MNVPAKPNILLIRLKSIGDIVFTLPAACAVREAFPEGRISYLVSKEYAPLLEGFRCVDAVLGLDRARLRRPNPVVILREMFSLLGQLRRSRFSLAVDFQGYGETALLARWSGAPQRWGTVYRGGRGWAYTRGVRRDPASHPAEDFLSLVRACGLRPGRIRNHFSLPDGAVEEARRLFVDWGLNAMRPTLFIQPFTSSPQKDWPLDRYLAVAGLWQGRGWQVIFGGGPAERDVLEPVRQAGFPVAAGASLLTVAGLTKLSALVLGSNTGLLHMAVAMGKRVLMLMDSTGPGSACPFQHHDWALAPANGQPVAAITTEAVTAACERVAAELGVSSEARTR